MARDVRCVRDGRAPALGSLAGAQMRSAPAIVMASPNMPSWLLHTRRSASHRAHPSAAVAQALAPEKTAAGAQPGAGATQGAGKGAVAILLASPAAWVRRTEPAVLHPPKGSRSCSC